jgi:methionine biosynthesis protein MetW
MGSTKLNEKIYSEILSTHGGMDDKYLLSYLHSKLFAMLEESDHILDIGCADGYLTEIIGKKVKAKNLFALEVSTVGVKRAAERGINVIRYDIDGYNLPYKSNCFDLIICTDVIEHIIHTFNLLEEIYRVLRHGGCLILSTGNMASWYNRILLLMGKLPLTLESNEREIIDKPFGRITGHVRGFTTSILKSMIGRVGFTLESFKTCPFNAQGIPLNDCNAPIRWGRNVMHIYELIFSLIPNLTSLMIVKCRKPPI